MGAISETLEALQAECDAMRGYDPDYYAKMMHSIPRTTVVDRVAYILEQCRGKRVLHLGCGWPPGGLHQVLEQVTAVLWGVDCAIPLDNQGEGWWRIDLDETPGSIPVAGYDIILTAEILEHLGNPGRLLQTLKQKYLGRETRVLITVPNAHSRVGYYHITGGVEQVNREHVAWYSWHTLQELVTRYGYEIEDFRWYNCPRNAQPQESEGLIMLVR